MIRVLDSYNDDSLQQYTRLYSSYFLLLICIQIMYATHVHVKKAHFARPLSPRTREAGDDDDGG
jgi:hypothetical protein